MEAVFSLPFLFNPTLPVKFDAFHCSETGSSGRRKRSRWAHEHSITLVVAPLLAEPHLGNT